MKPIIKVIQGQEDISNIKNLPLRKVVNIIHKEEDMFIKGHGNCTASIRRDDR